MIDFCNVQFNGLSKDELINSVKKYTYIITVNAEYICLVNEDEKSFEIMKSSLCTFDGQVPYLMARLMNPFKKFDKISGSEFVYDILDYSKLNGKRVFILGGSEEDNFNAVKKVNSKYCVVSDGFSPPHSKYPFSSEVNNYIALKIQSFKPDFLFVCMNAKKSNYWAYDNRQFLEDIGITFSIGLGGTVDMLSGRVPHSPKFFKLLGLESFYRLATEFKLFRLMRIINSFRFFKYLFFRR